MLSAGSRHGRWGRAVEGACAALGVLAALAGCGSEASRCPLEDSGASDDSSDVDGAPGTVAVHGTFSKTTCPAVNTPGASPDNGGLVILTATISSSPLDGGTATITWSATNGIFRNPHALDTTFQCVALGIVTVTVTVSIGDCSQQASLDLDCDVLAGGGN